MSATETPVLRVRGLGKRFGSLVALEGVDLDIGRGQTVGLVGESGCGKSTVALGIMRDLGANGRIVGGSIRFKDRDLVTLPQADLRRIRGSEIAMIYQEPMASLNPAMKVGRQLMEVPMIHEGVAASEARARALRARPPPG